MKINDKQIPTNRVIFLHRTSLEKGDKMEWLTEDKACELLGISKKTIQNYVSSGRIPSSFYERSFECKRLYNKNKLLVL